MTVSAMTAMALALDWKKISAYAARMGDKKDYPVVVIGAGLGGLCCGAYLARQGIPVTVVEQHSIPGGYATAFDRAGGKYTFEVSLHGTSINNNATARILQDLGVLDRLDLVRLPEVYRLKSPGLDISVPQADPEGYIQLLTQHFPAGGGRHPVLCERNGGYCGGGESTPRKRGQVLQAPFSHPVPQDVEYPE